MIARPRQAAGQGLIVLNIFVLFLLLFSEKLVLPFWLQPMGRMHLMILHLPLVLLGLAVWLDLYRFKDNININDTPGRWSRSLLMVGAWLAGITVIMGLFLSREEGYKGDALPWHQWTGAVLFLASSGLCWMTGRPWYGRALARLSAVVLTGLLFATGHYGATLTHGDGFILKPVTDQLNKKQVSLEQAVVYADVIQPILERKCVSCHNQNKLKGELSLVDSLGLLKGGKSGTLFIPGNSDLSLMMERIHLPMDQEKHMPPADQAQLTSTEITLLSLWIRGAVGFHQKLVSLPEDDSIRVIATAYFNPPVDSSNIYDFPAADEETIKRLNTNDRNISRLSKESPALEVSIYRRGGYGVQQLEELKDIREQVVSLKLNKLPVKDEDLKAVGQFGNLRKLDLNFTGITDQSLGILSSLKNLRAISLSGTAVTLNGLKQGLAGIPRLNTVTLWSTTLTAQDVSDLQQTYPKIKFIGGAGTEGRDTLTLNPPLVRNSTLVFRDSLAVELGHPVRGVDLRYTLDGTMPDSLTSPLFRGQLTIKGNTKVMVKAYKSGWHSSEVVQFDFLRNAYIPDSVQLLYPLNSVHLAEGANTFFDTRLGVFGANNPAWANFWAGARKNPMGILCFFRTPVTLTSFGLHYMVEEETGIHPPATVEVWGGPDPQHLKLLATIRPPAAEKKEKLLKIAETVLRGGSVSCLKIIANPPLDAKSKQPRLILVDEMFLN